MKVDRVAAAHHDLRQQPVREALAPRAIGTAGEQAVEVVVVLRVHVDAALVEARPVEERDDEDRPTDLRRIKAPTDPDRRLDAGVLSRVNARRDEHRGPVRCATDGDERPAVLLQTRVAPEGELTGPALAGRRQ